MKDRRMFNLGDQGQGAGEPPAGPAVPLLDAALYYAGLGWSGFPCEPRGKRPFGALAPHGVKDATCDALVIRAWWRQCPDANIGLACGHLFWVLDVDGEEGKATLAGLQSRHGALPPTVTSLTGSGGWHLFFGLPSGRTVRNSVRRLGLGLDTRGLGGYVIAPPSIHPSGQAYGFAEGFTPWSAPLAVAPAWLLDLLDPPTAPQAATTTRAAPGGGTDAYARVALE